jgi:hypothetical protein
VVLKPAFTASLRHMTSRVAAAALLKAYNQANDRYFTQSSLNTQGIGIKFQRDFNRFREIFLRVKKKSKKDKEKPSH